MQIRQSLENTFFRYHIRLLLKFPWLYRSRYAPLRDLQIRALNGHLLRSQDD